MARRELTDDKWRTVTRSGPGSKARSPRPSASPAFAARNPRLPWRQRLREPSAGQSVGSGGRGVLAAVFGPTWAEGLTIPGRMISPAGSRGRPADCKRSSSPAGRGLSRTISQSARCPRVRAPAHARCGQRATSVTGDSSRSSAAARSDRARASATRKWPSSHRLAWRPLSCCRQPNEPSARTTKETQPSCSKRIRPSNVDSAWVQAPQSRPSSPLNAIQNRHPPHCSSYHSSR